MFKTNPTVAGPNTKIRRPQNAKEKVIAAAIQELMAVPGARVLELLFLLDASQWSAFIHGDATKMLRQELFPIADTLLQPYKLNQESNIEDAVQLLYLKLQDGRYFKSYRAMESIPRAFILGCAPNYGLTIGRSIWRATRRHLTNYDCFPE